MSSSGLRGPPGQSGGETQEIGGSAEVSINFGIPNLANVNTGDLIFNLETKPFFSGRPYRR